jgi:SEL1 protein
VQELGKLIEESPELETETKYSHFDLLLATASRGNEDAQHKLSVALGTGIYRDSIVPMDSSRALLLEYLAALSGSAEAAMGMGYRYHNGIGVSESCEKALPFYEIAANHAIEFVTEKNGFVSPPDRTRLSDSGDQSLKWLKESSNELTDYYSHLAASGESTAASLLGNLYTSGSKNIEPNEELAIHYLKLAVKLHYTQASGLLGYLMARRYHNNKENETKNKKTATEKHPATTTEGDEDYSSVKIFSLFQNSMKSSDLNGIIGLGFCYLHGIGTEKNQSKAMEFFYKVLPTHPDAGFYIGEEFMKNQANKQTPASSYPPPQYHSTGGWRNQEISSALHAYSTSAQLGNVLSQHRLAQMHNNGWGASRSCEAAVMGFKTVAERGEWSLRLSEAHRHYSAGDSASALQLFSSLAALGYESAQFNAAYILFKSHCPAVSPFHPELLEAINAKKDFKEEEESSLLPSNSVTALSPSVSEKWKKKSSSLSSIQEETKRKEAADHKYDCDARALSLFSLSAAQGNSDSYVQIGDFYYYRLASFNQSREISANYYQKAADLHNTQAIFNLGLMHEIGDGVKQDFHLAKRYYDLAAEVDVKARTPRDIALFMLEVSSVPLPFAFILFLFFLSFIFSLLLLLLLFLLFYNFLFYYY